MSVKLQLFALLSLLGLHSTSCFTPISIPQHRGISAALSSSSSADDQWQLQWLTNDNAIRKNIISPGNGDAPQDGDEVSINYVGTLAERSWTVQDVVDCWLSEQQGFDSLGPKFIEANVDGSKLLDETYFTESFVAEVLGVENRIQCKKMVMAAKRLAKEIQEYPTGIEFDSTNERGAYNFCLGKGKVIKATELAVSSMNRGERAKIVARSDYAYGKEGLRRPNGDILVPSFATLEFDLTLLE